MPNSASIAQGFYQAHYLWNTALKQEGWKLAIWVSPYENVEIVNSYLGMEETIYGQSKEIFFSFRSVFSPDKQNYEACLWGEFLSWFQEVTDPKYDMVHALVSDGLLEEKFTPNAELPPTFSSVLSELERLRSVIKAEDLSFILNFAVAESEEGCFDWWNELLEKPLESVHICFTIVDIKERRVLRNFSSNATSKIYEIDCSSLHGASATKAALKKEVGRNNPHSPEAEYKRLVLDMMEALPKREKVLPFFPLLLDKAKQIANPGILTSTHLAIAHALNTLKMPKEGLEEIEEGVSSLSEVEGTVHWYPLWRSCMLFKAAFLISMKKDEEAFLVYKEIIRHATQMQDHLYIMESYRICASIRQNSKKNNEAFEYAMLSLYVGAYFDEVFRRSSTYLNAAQIANETVDKVNRSGQKREILEDFLIKWIGEDWKERIVEKSSGERFVLITDETDIITQS